MPTVSCIMPIKNRRKLLPLALRSYLAQTWADKELIVVDDGTEKIDDLLRDIPNLTYVHLGEKALTIGAKRNYACDLAHGDLIAHLDSDDWSFENRIRTQVAILHTQAHCSVTGYNSMLFWDIRSERGYRYKSNTPASYAIGSSLCYRRAWWKDHPFPDQQRCEDNAFVITAREAQQLTTQDGGQRMVATIHDSNTSVRNVTKADFWTRADRAEFPLQFFEHFTEDAR